MHQEIKSNQSETKQKKVLAIRNIQSIIIYKTNKKIAGMQKTENTYQITKKNSSCRNKMVQYEKVNKKND